MRIEVGFRTST